MIISFLPMLTFVSIYVGSGLYFSLSGVDNAFYQLSPLVAILPAIMLGWLLHRGNTEQRMHALLDGIRHRDIITMCLIFLLAGAFGAVTQAIGSVEATVQLALSLIAPQFLLMGVFITAAFISMAMGTSMGTIAAMAPVAAGLSTHGAFPAALGAATVVGGAMFGDNLSIISDTTIAAVLSQRANLQAKLRLNALIAAIAALITLGWLWLQSEGSSAPIMLQPYSLLRVAPYGVLIILALCGINVLITLVIGLIAAGLLGMVDGGYGWLHYSRDIVSGLMSMQEIMLLSMLVGGLSGLVGEGTQKLSDQISRWLARRQAGQRLAQLLIAAIVSLFDLLLANNTIAIIFSGDLAREIAKQYQIPPHYSATWLGIFSCVVQGLIPYSAQILLASGIAGISPLKVIGQVYYCYALGAVALLTILGKQIERPSRGSAVE
jgi:Na+/H+ antiporter NhaC